jgi:hypothetical protein
MEEDVAYRLKPGRPATADVQRIIDKQLKAASAALRPGARGVTAQAIHAARRRVKKALAAVRLVRPTLTISPQSWKRVLRDVNRSLAPVSDGDAVIGTLSRVSAGHPAITPAMAAAVRRRLVRFERRIERSARIRRACRASSALLVQLTAEVRDWKFKKPGFDALAPGLKRSFRRARRAMVRAERRPNTKTYHAWRQRSKDHWLHLRLLEARCHGRLTEERRLVETLDECLGEHHNVALLADLFVTRPLASRDDTVIWLQALRDHRTALRARARDIAQRIYQERPRDFVRRVRRAWKIPADQRASNPPARTKWPQAA